MAGEQDLVFEKTKVSESFDKLNKLIYGFPKTGKTTIVSCMKDLSTEREPLFLTTESGHNALSVYAQTICDEKGDKNWEKFLKIRDYIVANTEKVRKKYSCIAIDLVSDLDDFCTQYILTKNKVKTLADLEWGKGWALQQTEFQFGIRPLFNVLPLVFITHSKEKDVVYNGNKIKTQAPTMSTRCFDYINGKVDMIGFIVPAQDGKKDKPILSFKPSQMAIAGSRFGHMCHDFELDYEDMQGSYDKIAEFFKTKGVKK